MRWPCARETSFCTGTTKRRLNKPEFHWDFDSFTHLYVGRLGSISWDDTKVEGSLGTPLPMFPAFLHPIGITE